MNTPDFRKKIHVVYVYDHERKERYSKLDFTGFYKLKAKSIDRSYMPARMQLKFTDKYLNFHAVGELWGKYSQFDRYKFITALRIDKSSAILQYYGDNRDDENKTKSFFFIEFQHRRRFILHYFHDFMPEYDNKWMFVHSMQREGRIIEAKKTILNQLDI